MADIHIIQYNFDSGFRGNYISVPRKPKFVKCYSLFMTIIRYVCREINCGNPRNTKSCVKRGKNGSKIARKWSI